MRLCEVRHQICDGDVCLFIGNKPHSLVIKLKSLSVYSHVGMFVWLRRRLWCVESLEPHGVRVVPFERYLYRCMVERVPVEWFAMTDHALDRESLTDYCLDRVLMRYASGRQFWRSFLFVGDLVRRLFGLSVDTSRDRYFCSELIADAYRHAGFLPMNGIPREPARTTPGDVSRYPCLQRKGVLTL